jgi:FkbM family methyltransferase
MKNWIQFIREAYWEFRAGRWVGFHVIEAYLMRSIVDVRGVRIKIHRSLSYLIVRSLLDASYEASERSLLESALRPEDVVFELGAGLGYVSTVCARMTDSRRVFVYEANPMMEPMIRNTFGLNGVDPTLHMCMVGKDAGTTKFHVSRDFWASSTLPHTDHSEPVTVRVVSFQEEMDRVKPTVLIVDIEGGEYDLFREFPRHVCRLIMLELHPKVLGETRAADVLHWIEAMGFRCSATMQDSYLYERVAGPVAHASSVQ